VTIAPVDTILEEHLNLGTNLPDFSTSFDFNEQVPLEELEKRYIRYIYFKSSRNKARTADILGIDRKTLYSKLAKYGIEETE
jgi:DNA-binding NtrC family response regulator